ncbi:MAG: hypothetical protein ABI702_14565 [Burkholderiales bacterium]
MKRLLHPIVFVLAVILVFEEWLWDKLKAGFRRLATIWPIRALDRALRTLPPWPSLLVLLLPALVLFPFKIAALWAVSNGQSMLGVAVLIGAKLVGTGLAAWLFDAVRDSARRLPWFDRLYVGVMSVLSRTRAWLHAQPAYLAAKAAVARARAWAARVLRGSARSGRLRRKLRAAKALFGRR